MMNRYIKVPSVWKDSLIIHIVPVVRYLCSTPASDKSIKHFSELLTRSSILNQQSHYTFTTSSHQR